jgi:hypothetical protein
MSEFTPLSYAREVMSALELAIRATMVHEGLEMIHANVEEKSACYSPEKIFAVCERLEKQRQSETFWPEDHQTQPMEGSAQSISECSSHIHTSHIIKDAKSTSCRQDR